MYFQPSRNGGFARNDAESAFPELWAGLTGAWVPGLGASCVSMRHVNNTGTNVEDLSGFGGNMIGDGTTRNSVTTGGGPAYDFLATSLSYLTLADGRDARNMFRTNGATLVVHKLKTDSTNRDAAIFGTPSLVASDRLNLWTPAASGNLIFDFGGNTGPNRLSVAGLTFGDDVFVCRGGTMGLYVWQNGELVGFSATAVTFGNGSSTFRWGGGPGSNSDLCRSKVLLTFDRELSDADCLRLSMNPYLPFVVKHPVKLVAGAGPVDFDQELGQDLNLAQSATFTIDRLISVSQTLTFAQATEPTLNVEIEHDLGLYDYADALVFIGDVHHLSDDLGLTDSVEADNANVDETGDFITFTQSVSVLGPIYVEVHDYLALNDGVDQFIGVPWLPIEIHDVLEFTQRAGRGLPVSVSQTLTFTDAAYRSYVFADTLNLTDSIEYGKGPADPTEQALNLTQTVTVNAEFLRSIEHTFILQDSFTYFMDSPCIRKNYSPFEGGTASMPELGLQFKSQFMLETLSGAYSAVVLRNPETDDRDRLGFNRVNRETRGGELNVFSDPTWAKVNTLIYTLTATKRAKLDALQTFLQDSLGQEIKITDWLGGQWRGVITTPNETAVEDDDGYWTFTFEFEGVAYEGQAPEGRLSLTQTVEVQVVPLEEV